MHDGKDLREAMDAADSDALDSAMEIWFGSTRVSTEPAVLRAGETIGRYKLLEQIGEGGFGVVYMAEQQEPIRRRVALKIIKLGMDTRQVVARFEAERQALAMMDHENIASVLDAGATDTGRPYFVMELVRGVSITEYCDRGKLKTEDRLKLFVAVCNAVQHAHQKGIIHRDLKPNNVMVTLRDGAPIPKVIDFGVAKATQVRLTDKTVFTRYGQFIGTPAYMSPEQVEMNELDIDTRSDIYSLGVLLYELLTGSTPIDEHRLRQASYSDMQRMICEHEPLKPSSRLSQSGETLASISAHRATEPRKLGQLLRGDLDWIVMKALEKDRSRRYETANGLAADVARFLEGEPVSASPPSAVYKLRKLAAKHKGLIAAAASFVVVLLAAAILSSVMAIRARQAELVANDKRDEADRLQTIADQQRDEMRWNLYCAEMNVAQLAFRMPGGANRFAELLSKWRSEQPDLRGWEWYYLNSLRHRELMLLDGHADVVTSVRYSPDGQRLATASRDRTIRIWDAATGENLQTLKGHLDHVLSVAWSPDGKRLASAGADRLVNVWDAETGQQALRLQGHEGAVHSVSWHPTGRRLASASEDTTVRLWDTESGFPEEVLRGHTKEVIAVAWSGAGDLLMSASRDETILLWDPETWQRRPPLEHRNDLLSLSSSDDGKRLAASYLGDPRIRVWDLATSQEPTFLVGHANHLRDTAWSPDGSRLVSAGEDGSLRIWNMTTGQELLTLHGGAQWSVSFSRDGQRFASGGDDGNVRIWSALAGQGPTFVMEDGPDVFAATWSRDGGRLAMGCADNTVRVWDAARGELRVVGRHDSQVFSVGWSEDGRLASGGDDGRVKLYTDVMAETEPSLISSSDILSVAWSPDGRKVAAAGGAWQVHIWDALTGEKLQTLQGHARWITAFCWSQDGTRIASCSADRTVRLWDCASGNELWSVVADSHQVNGLSWSPDGSRLAASAANDADIKILDGSNGKQFLRLTGHTEWVFMTSWSPDGKRLASASADGTVRIWDTKTGQETLTLRGHSQFVRSVAWHPDGRRLTSAGRDGKVLIWDATKGFEDAN